MANAGADLCLPARYALCAHVFLCVDEDSVVVLELRQDRYFTFPAARTASLADLVPGWPVRGNTGGENGADVAEMLCQRGFLVKSPARGKDATPVQVPGPSIELLPPVDEEHQRRAPIRARTVLAFLRAAITAKLSLKLLPFERVIRRARRRKEAHQAPPSLDLVRARELVESYRRLRIYLFSSKEECLFDSLALLEFLARHNVFPDWIFGVRARPFGAHCWVQSGTVVVNDSVEHVAGYKAIMRV